MSVLALALKRLALSQGTVPKDCPNGTLANGTEGSPASCPDGTRIRDVPTGQAQDGGTSGTVGTLGTAGTAWTAGTIGTANAATIDRDDADAIEERAGLAADGVQGCYLDAWARLNHQRPFAASEAEWRLALNDGGLFLDAWGDDAAALGWTPGELFDVTAGLVWRLAGRRVDAVRRREVRVSDGEWIPLRVEPNEVRQ